MVWRSARAAVGCAWGLCCAVAREPLAARSRRMDDRLATHVGLHDHVDPTPERLCAAVRYADHHARDSPDGRRAVDQWTRTVAPVAADSLRVAVCHSLDPARADQRWRTIAAVHRDSRGAGNLPAMLGDESPQGGADLVMGETLLGRGALASLGEEVADDAEDDRPDHDISPRPALTDH